MTRGMICAMSEGMTTIQRTQSELSTQESHTNHALALLAALAPDPSKWEYRGECFEGDENSHCACGHPIRWLFPIYFENQTKIVGSTCVNHFAAINPATGQLMIDKLAELQTKLSDQKKAAARAAADAENAALWTEYCNWRDAAISAHRTNRQRYVRSPYQLWHFAESYREQYRVTKQPEYTRPCDLKKWLVKAIARAKSAMQPEAVAA